MDMSESNVTKERLVQTHRNISNDWARTAAKEFRSVV